MSFHHILRGEKIVCSYYFRRMEFQIIKQNTEQKNKPPLQNMLYVNPKMVTLNQILLLSQCKCAMILKWCCILDINQKIRIENWITGIRGWLMQIKLDTISTGLLFCVLQLDFHSFKACSNNIILCLPTQRNKKP